MVSFTFSWAAVPERVREKLITDVLRQSWDAYKVWQKTNVPKEGKQTKWEYITDVERRTATAAVIAEKLNFGDVTVSDGRIA